MRVSNGMLDDFREFATDVFESRAEHISDGLAKEQMLIVDKYTYLEHRMLNRATVALDFLREVMPTFNWYKYRENGEAYLKRLISRQPPVAAAFGGPGAGGGGADVAVPVGAPPIDDENDDDEDGNDVDAQRSVATKKLLYTLNTLRTDLTRIECEGQRLYEQRNGLLATMAESNAELSAVQCRSSGDVNRLKDELAALQRHSAEQTVTIDRLMEKTQLAMQNKKHPTQSGNC